MTWPTLASLLNKMEDYPPIDFLAAAWVQKQKPKPIAEQISTLGIPHRKGKVKKRGDVSR